MPTRRIMKSVLEGLLGTYTSRYSDFHGFWLFGQLPSDKSEFHFDLLGPMEIADSPECVAQRLAICRFMEQLVQSGLDAGLVRCAYLKIKRHTGVVEGWHGDQRSAGHMVEFAANATMDNGHTFERTRLLFVAPHDPRKERRRSPGNQGT